MNQVTRTENRIIVREHNVGRVQNVVHCRRKNGQRQKSAEVLIRTASENVFVMYDDFIDDEYHMYVMYSSLQNRRLWTLLSNEPNTVGRTF
jgi:hypothetical protein